MMRCKTHVLFLLCAALCLSLLAGCTGGAAGSGPVLPSSSVASVSMPERTASAPGSTASGGALSAEQTAILQSQAQILTEHLVTKALDGGSIPGALADIKDIEVARFVLSMAFYLEDAAHPYSGYVTRTPETLYLFPDENVRQIAFRVFGRENFDLGAALSGVDVTWNEQQQRYESGLEFGLGGGNYDCQGATASYVGADSTIAVSFTLTSYLTGEDDPTWSQQQPCAAVFAVMQEDGAPFLRFVETRLG